MVYIKRGKNKIKPDFGIKDIYKYYNENSNNPLDYKKFKMIWLDFIKIIIKLIVNNNLDFAMPARVGTLSARKMKIKLIVDSDGKVIKNNLKPNYKACWEKWFKEYPNATVQEIISIKDKKYVYHLNEHSDGYKVLWRWDKFTCTVKNQSLYCLRMTRENSKKLSNAFISFNTNYYEYNRR